MDDAARRRLPPGSHGAIQEFLALDRRRVRPQPPLTPRELERWTELRWRIDELLGDGARVGERVRRALRVPTDLPVRVDDAPPGELRSARTIAEGGLFLATEDPAPPGTPLHLRIHGEAGEIVVKGVVAWARTDPAGGEPPGMGVRFEDLDAAQHEGIADLVQAALAAL